MLLGHAVINTCDSMCLHPVRNPRFWYFRTQPLEDLSAAVKLPIKQRFLGNPTLGTNLGSRILAMRTGCNVVICRSRSRRSRRPGPGGLVLSLLALLLLVLVIMLAISSSTTRITLIVIIVVIIVCILSLTIIHICNATRVV